MGRVKKSKAYRRENVKKATEALRLTDEDRKSFAGAPKLTLMGPKQLHVERGNTTREMKLAATKAWKFVVANFHKALRYRSFQGMVTTLIRQDAQT